MKKNIVGGASLLAAGLIAGSFFSITGANAATHHVAKAVVVKSAAVTPTPTPSTGTTPVTPPTFKSHTPETPITGDLATTLTNLALAKYPGATIVRVENDTDGSASEVHLTTTDGKNVTVTFDANNAIVDTKVGGPGFGPRGDHPKAGPRGDHGFGGHGDNDGDGPGAGFTPSAPSTPVTPLNG
jgi:hypothetical protein